MGRAASGARCSRRCPWLMPEGVRASGAAIFENAHSTLLLAGSRHGTNRRSLQFPHVGASALVYINICLKAARLEEVGAVGVEQRGVDLAGRVLQRQLHRVHPAAAARACGRACGARRQRELRAARPDSGRRAAFRARAAAARRGRRATQVRSKDARWRCCQRDRRAHGASFQTGMLPDLWASTAVTRAHACSGPSRSAQRSNGGGKRARARAERPPGGAPAAPGGRQSARLRQNSAASSGWCPTTRTRQRNFFTCSASRRSPAVPAPVRVGQGRVPCLHRRAPPVALAPGREAASSRCSCFHIYLMWTQRCAATLRQAALYRSGGTAVRLCGAPAGPSRVEATQAVRLSILCRSYRNLQYLRHVRQYEHAEHVVNMGSRP